MLTAIAYGVFFSIVHIFSNTAVFGIPQKATYIKQIGENQQSLKKTASNYDELMGKYNALLSYYSTLYGSYSFPGANFTLLMKLLGRSIDNLKGNCSSLLMEQEDLNETYCTLKENYQLVHQEGNVTEEDFGRLLNIMNCSIYLR